jgi:CubicO group peptidase (beta-lactamase class C family)
VTIHQLLTHTSGLGPPAIGLAPPPPPWSSVDEVFEGTMAMIREAPPLFTPGTQFGYTNAEFWVLAAIVAQISGQSYFDYVRQHIFARAGMTRSDFYTRPQVLSDTGIARPYATQPSGDRGDFTMDPYNSFIGGPDGGAYSSVLDLLSFANCLHSGRLLSGAYAELMTGGKVAVRPTQTPSPPGEQLSIAYGFEATIFGGQRVFGHPGNGPGKATSLDVFPDQDWVSVVLSNYDTSIKPIVQLERALVSGQA